MAVHEVFPYLRVVDAPRAIEFYRVAFGATEKFRLSEPSGRVGHAELDFGGTTVMVSEEFPEFGIHAPKAGAPSGMAIHLHVDDADAVMRRAVAAGAVVVREPQDHFYGERSGKLRDPFGHEWLVGHHIEDVSPEEMQRRYTAMFNEQ